MHYRRSDLAFVLVLSWFIMMEFVSSDTYFHTHLRIMAFNYANTNNVIMVDVERYEQHAADVSTRPVVWFHLYIILTHSQTRFITNQLLRLHWVRRTIESTGVAIAFDSLPFWSKCDTLLLLIAFDNCRLFRTDWWSSCSRSMTTCEVSVFRNSDSWCQYYGANAHRWRWQSRRFDA